MAAAKPPMPAPTIPTCMCRFKRFEGIFDRNLVFLGYRLEDAARADDLVVTMCKCYTSFARWRRVQSKREVKRPVAIQDQILGSEVIGREVISTIIPI